MKDKINISINLDEISDSLDQAIEFLNENGVRFTEIRTINGKNIVDFDLPEVKKIATMLSKKGLQVSAIASPLFKWYLDPSGSKTQHDNFSFNPLLSNKQKNEYILKTIKIAEIFKTRNVRVFSNLRQEGILPEEIFEDKIFKYMLQKFGELGLNPLLENEPVCLISKGKDYLLVLQTFEDMGLRAWWDIANSYNIGDRVDESIINKLMSYVKYLHLKNKIFAQEKTYVPLGAGFINYKRIFSDLIPVLGTNIFASIETHVHLDKMNATKQSLDYLNDLLHKPRVTYALVGAGKVSKKHSGAFKENINSELRGVFDINTERARIFARQNDVKVYTSFDQLLSDKKVQVVTICTPHDTHINLAKMAVSASKVVLSEKPFAINSEILKNYLRNKKAANNTYVVFQYLFNKPIQRLLDNLQKGRFGKLQFFAANIRWSREDSYFDDWHGKICQSGGSLFNQAIHTIQLILLLSKSRIKTVSYQKKTVRKNSETEDLGIATFEFENGLFGYLELCLINKGVNLESSFYLVGDNGSVKVDGRSLDQQVYEYFQNSAGTSHKISSDSNYQYSNSHALLIKTLSNKLLGRQDDNEKYLVKSIDVLPIVRIIERLYGKKTR